MVQTNDDIVKAHGGEIKADTKEEEGCNFKIVLPKSQAFTTRM
jgi:signal transduction histidine kinase